MFGGSSNALGRQLATFTLSGVTYEFDYNADGIRTYKAGGGLTTQYVLNGSQVMRQIINDGTTNYIADYIYHENGTPMAFAFYQQGGTPTYYFYETNLQGDVMLELGLDPLEAKFMYCGAKQLP